MNPRCSHRALEIRSGLQHRDGKTILMVEQNAKKGLEFADIGYVPAHFTASGRLSAASTAQSVPPIAGFGCPAGLALCRRPWYSTG